MSVNQRSTNVDERNWFIIMFDLILQECLKAIDGKETFLYLMAPYFYNYRLPTSWPSFTSNLFVVSDIENLKDLIKMARRHGIPVTMQCYPKWKLEKSLGANEAWHRKYHDELLEELHHIGCKITLNPDDHGKLIACSQGALNSSANLSGTAANPAKQGNLGDYFPYDDRKDSSYQKKLVWAKDWFNDNKTTAY